MSEKQLYLVLSYYHLLPISDPKKEVIAHKRFMESLDIKGRIYITPQGINGTVSALPDVAETYVQWLRSKEGFEDLEVKAQKHESHAFYKLTVKVKKELVALGRDIDLTH